MLRRAVLACTLLTTASALYGQDWAAKMFKDTAHDFGTVARGADSQFRFEITNPYVEDVHITGARSSCGCTSVQVEKPWLKTYEKGAILATFNTKAFLGQRHATLTVTIDKPFYGEVQLQITGYIRGDLMLEPGSVQLGSVEQGAAAKTKIGLSYTGRSDWKITGVHSSNPHIHGELTETSRYSGQVAYNLVVRLDPNAPAGYLNDQLLLMTNDAQQSQVLVKVEGQVRSSITVSPASLFMGVVPPGQEATKQLVVSGVKPFRILSIHCDDPRFKFNVKGADQPKALHLIPVTFGASESTGKVTRIIRIETDLGESKPELSAYAVVEKGEAAGPALSN